MGVFTGTSGPDVVVGTDDADQISGGDGNDSLSGGGGDDAIDGDNGNDVLDGGAGNDTLRGGAGDDVLRGRAGDDVIDGGEGNDLASFRSAPNGVYVSLWDHRSVDTGEGRDTLVGIESVEGSAFDDRLIGDEGANRLIGLAGNDLLAGLDGLDDLRGGPGDDVYLFEHGSEHPGAEITDNEGVNVVRFTAFDSDTLTLFAGDTGISRVELAIGNQYADHTVDARAVLNALEIRGGDGANTLLGTGFDDRLYGLFGDDTLTGGAGRDLLVGGRGLDVFSDTSANFNGDTIEDFAFGEKIVFTDANLATFAFELTGNRLSYTGGTLTLTAPLMGKLAAAAAPGGGVMLFVTSSLVPALPASPGPPNISFVPNGDPFGPGFVVESGAYAHWLVGQGQIGGALLFNYSSITNRGSILLENTLTTDATIGLASYQGSFTNSGTIVAHDQRRSDGPLTLLLQPTNSFGQARYDNSGAIFIQNDHGDARFLVTYQLAPDITNSGLIALYSPDGASVGLEIPNGARIVNGASGRILVEAGLGAIGIKMTAPVMFPGEVNAVEVTNAGLIEVRAHGSIAGIGVDLGFGEVVNSGTIIADVAVWLDGTLTNSGRLVGMVASDEFLTFNNQATGRLEGDLVGGAGQSQYADQITNAGVITGDVSLRFGDDVFSNVGSGRVDGIVDLGEGNDRFVGGAAVDRVTGDSGDDVIDGGAGDDLLLGGTGNDRLEGGAGNDGLYGEAGRDVIVTSGGDVVSGGSGDDRVELGDYSFRSVRGGGGTDTLVLAPGAIALDLSKVLATGRVDGFEVIALRAEQHLILRAADVAAINTASELRIEANASDLITLVGYWARGADTVVDGLAYARWMSDGATILTSLAAPVALTLNAPAGSGLAPIAAGAKPLVPGPAAGLGLTPTDFLVTNYLASSTLTIDEGERWITTGTSPIAFAFNDSAQVVNAGSLWASNPTGPTAIAIELDYQSTRVTNSGSIVVESRGSTTTTDTAIQLLGSTAVVATFVVNSGLIESRSSIGAASAIGEVGVFLSGTAGDRIENLGRSALNVLNSGTIRAVADTGYAVGIVSAVDVVNSGLLSVSGSAGSVGVVVDRSLVNERTGSIVAEAIGATTATAVRVVYSSNWLFGEIRNAGLIAGRVAIDARITNGPVTLTNSGQIVGEVRMSDWSDRVTNSGQIDGIVSLFGGADRFDGSQSARAQQVQGGDGDDVIIGGRASDIIFGGAGVDTLTGGSGNDTFMDVARAWQGDTITDFSVGDRIVVTDVVGDFTFAFNGSVLSFTGGSLTLASPVPGRLVAARAPEGGYQITIDYHHRASGDANGDGRSDVLLQSSSGGISVWRAQAGGTLVDAGNLAPNALDASWRVAGFGDFNGDGREDVLWRHSSGVIGQWSGQTGQFTNNSGVAANAVDNSWSVVGVADYNGDGRDDILWRHSSGEIGQWVAQPNGSFANNGGAAANLVDPSWSVVASGDFNGDGRADILWRHISGVYAEWQGSATGKLNNAGAVLGGATGTVVGSGDFNGDGRDDIVMRNAATGAIGVYLGQGNGQFAAFTPSAQVADLNWKIAAIGDYNGDGRDDLIWKHVSGVTAMWLGTLEGDFINNGAGPIVASGSAVQSPDIWIV
jgi:Ca2+-binding RTX toxin-like protein